MQVNDEFLLFGELPRLNRWTWHHNGITHQLLGALKDSWLVEHVDHC